MRAIGLARKAIARMARSYGETDAAQPSPRGGSGRSHSQIATTAMQPMPSSAIHARGAAHHRMTAHADIIAVASHFARRDTAPCSCQSRITGPKRGCACSQRCSRS